MEIKQIYMCRLCNLHFTKTIKYSSLECEIDELTRPSTAMHKNCGGNIFIHNAIGIGDLIGFQEIDKEEAKK